MKKLCLNCFCMFLVAALFGCGGGGGGSSNARITTEIFTDWSSVDPPAEVGFTGLSQDTLFEIGPGIPPFTRAVDEINTAGVSATIRYRSDGSVERINIKTPRTALSWDATAGDIIDSGQPMVLAGNPGDVIKFGVFYNPLHPAADPWEYQSFGAWADARPIAAGAVGALSVGTPTPGDVLTTLVGGASFEGHSAGIYTTSDGSAAYVTESAVTVDVDFLARTLDFRTTGTTLTNIEGGKPWPDAFPPSLDATGTLTYAPGDNSFNGTVTAVGTTGVMQGESTGQFYGPGAQELGGVFSLTGPENLPDGREHYSGAYGAAR